MVEGITEYMREKLLTLSYADLVGGLVVPLKTKKGDVEKTVPAYKRLHLRDECDEGDYVYMIPNDKKKSVMFIEHESTRFTEWTERFAEAESLFNIVCWYSYHATNKNHINALPYQIEIMKAFDMNAQNITYENPITASTTTFYGVRFEPVMGLRREQVWAKYTLPELKSQYGMYPYDYFAFQFRVTYRFLPACVPDCVGDNSTECVTYKPETE